MRSSPRASNAARPAGVIRPSAISSRARRTLTALQVLRAWRGEKRIVYASSPRLRRTPSIHPKHSASSTDSGQVMLGRPELFL